MILAPIEKFCYALNLLQTRIKQYCSLHKETGQLYGLCIANPKRASIGVPTKEIHAELEKRARDHFTRLHAVGFYFRYWTPPLLPAINGKQTDLPVSADDYQLTFELPQFDEEWERTTVARSLIYCPTDQEQYGWNEWFEIQEEAIRFTPLLHHSLKECKTCCIIRMQLGQPGMPAFENFIYEYAKTDCNFPPMSKAEQEKWDSRQINWKIPYRLVANLFDNRMTLRTIYSTAHAKATSSRNPIVKSLL